MRIISSRISFRPLHAILICLVSASHVEPRPQSDTDAVTSESVVTATAPIRPPLTATGATVLPKPRGMSDAEYSKLISFMRARQMTEPERNDFWQNVQKIWKQFMDRLRKAAQRFAEFLDRLTRGPATRGTGGAGAASPAADGSGSPDDMFTRRVAKADSNTGRRIRPEEYGLTAEGLPRSQWDRGTGYHPVMRPSESRDRSIPDHVPRPPVPATSSTVQIPTASAKENEVRTGGIPTPGTASTQSADSSSNNSVKPGTAIHVTDQ